MKTTLYILFVLCLASVGFGDSWVESFDAGFGRIDNVINSDLSDEFATGIESFWYPDNTGFVCVNLYNNDGTEPCKFEANLDDGLTSASVNSGGSGLFGYEMSISISNTGYRVLVDVLPDGTEVFSDVYTSFLMGFLDTPLALRLVMPDGIPSLVIDGDFQSGGGTGFIPVSENENVYIVAIMDTVSRLFTVWVYTDESKTTAIGDIWWEIPTGIDFGITKLGFTTTTGDYTEESISLAISNISFIDIADVVIPESPADDDVCDDPRHHDNDENNDNDDNDDCGNDKHNKRHHNRDNHRWDDSDPDKHKQNDKKNHENKEKMDRRNR